MGLLDRLTGRAESAIAEPTPTEPAPQPAPKETPMTLTSKKHADRVQAHEARKREIAEAGEAIGREISRLQNQRHENTLRDLAAAEATVEAARVACQDALAAEWNRRIDPVVAKFTAEPSRRLAGEIGAIARELHTRAHEELGVGLWESMFTVALAHALSPANPGVIVNVGLDHPGMGAIVEKSGICFRRLDEAPALHDGLVALEVLLLDAGRRFNAEPSEEHARARARFAIKRRAATYGDAMRLLAAFDADVEAKKQAAFVAAYRPPEQATTTPTGFAGMRG